MVELNKTLEKDDKDPKKKHTNILFIVTALALCATIALQIRRPHLFYRMCAAIQIINIIGILIDSTLLMNIGHTGFAVSVFIGALVLPPSDIWIIYAACIVALYSRKVLNGCLFHFTKGKASTPSLITNVLYVIPMIVCFIRRRMVAN